MAMKEEVVQQKCQYKECKNDAAVKVGDEWLCLDCATEMYPMFFVIEKQKRDIRLTTEEG